MMVLNSRKVRKALKDRGMAQSELAKRLGVTPGHISLLLGEKREPSLTLFADLCKLLQLTPREAMRRCAGT